MKYILLGLLLSTSVFAGTDCWVDSRGGTHCTSSNGGRTDCWVDSYGGMHCS